MSDNRRKVYVIHEKDNNKLIYINKKPYTLINQENEFGLGEVVDGTMVEGETPEVEVVGVETIKPERYNEPDTFISLGLPIKMEVGKYKDNSFIRETYYKTIRGVQTEERVIKAFDKDENLIFEEKEIIHRPRYTGQNLYYNRINELVKDWEDITEETKKEIRAKLDKLENTIDINNEIIQQMLENLTYSEQENGTIKVSGKYEDGIIYINEENKPQLLWLNTRI